MILDKIGEFQLSVHVEHAIQHMRDFEILSGNGRPMKEVKTLRIFGLWIEEDLKVGHTLAKLRKNTTSVYSAHGLPGHQK